MDVCLSAKPQTLSLISCTALSSTGSCSLSPSGILSLHRDFLGYGHNLRPPGLRSQRKCKKLSFHVRWPRYLFRASLDSQSIVAAVAVVSVSTLAAVLLNNSKRKRNFGEVSVHSFLAMLERIKVIVNWATMDQICASEDLERRMYSRKNRSLKGMEEIDRAYEDKVFQLQREKSTMLHDETLISRTLEACGSEIIASGSSDSVSSGNSEPTLLSFSHPVLTESVILQPVDSAVKIAEIKFDGCGQETEFGSDLHEQEIGEKFTVASVLVDNPCSEVSEHKKSNSELIEESGTVGLDGSFKDSLRVEIYKFYDPDQFPMQSVANLNGLSTLSSNTSVQHNNRFSSSVGGSTNKPEKLLALDFLHTADRVLGHSESLEGNLPIEKDRSARKRANVGKSSRFSRGNEKRILILKGHEKLPKSPHPSEIHGNEKDNLSQPFSCYNRLLRDGRLIDCIQLLEDMEVKGVLDMNKVYHAGFFKICKSQKAVEEAFRFTRFIPNPTLSTFNMLLSVCASSQDSEGAFQVLKLVEEAGLKADCKLYTTLISTCAKSGKVDAMFKVFHEMINAEVEPNVHTYGALIDGCAKAGQIAKAFGAYGIMRSKNVKPDRVVFNALITACGQSGAVDRAFDVLAEMGAEAKPIDPDHITVGALIKACVHAGQVHRVHEVYNMIDECNIKGTPELYTIAVNSCSPTGDWEFACRVHDDMKRKGVVPDEMFFSALIDVAGHAGKLDTAFEILKNARNQGIHVGIISYSSLMGACSNAKNWQKALELYEDIKSIKLKPTVSTMNALITALCDGERFSRAVGVLSEMKKMGLCPNTITYSILFVASEKKDDLEVGLMLFSEAKKDGVFPNLVMSRCLIAMCLRRFEKACTLGVPVLSFNSGRPQIDNKWTSLALEVYRETIIAGTVPTTEECSKVLGCLKLPYDASLRNRLTENLGVSSSRSKSSNLCSLLDGFGEYDPRAFSLFEEAASFGIVPCVSFKESPIVIDARTLQIHTAEVYILTVLKGLKNRLAAGLDRVKLPNVTILLPIEKTQIQPPTGEKTINLAGRITQAVAALLRRLGLPYQGNESYGKIRINGIVVRKWLSPKLASPFSGKPTDLGSAESRLGRGITHQQRNIRTGNLSLD